MTIHCPDCQRKVAAPPLLRYATQVLKRKCRCGQRWLVKIEPLRHRPGLYAAHTVIWTRI